MGLTQVSPALVAQLAAQVTPVVLEQLHGERTASTTYGEVSDDGVVLGQNAAGCKVRHEATGEYLLSFEGLNLGDNPVMLVAAKCVERLRSRIASPTEESPPPRLKNTPPPRLQESPKGS